MFESSQPFAFFDYFRVPYTLAPPSPAERLPASVGRLHRVDGAGKPGRSLFWLSTAGSDGPPRRVYRLGRYRLDDVTLVGRVSTKAPAALLETVGSGWRQSEPILDAKGQQVSSIWRDDEGNVFLPFDPGELMRHLWSEAYTKAGPRAALVAVARKTMLTGYYLVRPLLPRATQLAMRRVLARRQGAPTFPTWPIEHSLHDLYAWLFATVTEIAEAPVPWLEPWPDGKSWAFVLTHDVETQLGYADMGLLREGERAHGYRSSWNFVPERYDVDDDTVRRLRDEGCEIGLHGLRHDGRDLASGRLLEQRLPAMREHAARWGAVGFRSPATQRAWNLMPRLGFDYDSSYTDTDPYEPQPGGCCTYLPFFNEQLVELPITLPQDHTLFEILQHTDGKLWTSKAREVRARGGMVLVLAHPDYARDERMALGWRQLLDEFADDESMWQALPREVSSWWRRRNGSIPVLDGDRWTVSGPVAGEGRVRMTAYSAALTSAER